jgi:hypothetical protein
MKVSIYYLTVDHDLVNKEGWECDHGRRYLAASMKGDIEQGDYELAAEFEMHDDFEGHLDVIFRMMQNLDKPWTDMLDESEVHTDFTRSMSVGDLIVINDTDCHMVASVGFDQRPIPERVQKLMGA